MKLSRAVDVSTKLAKLLRFFILFISLGMVACNSHPSNYPHGKYLPEQNVFFATFTEPPKTLDPAKSYSADESVFVSQIYEPPLQYKYLSAGGNTPAYQLEPLTLKEMPEVTYYDESENLLSNTASPEKIAYSIYTLRLKPHISYQPHPAFVLDRNGQYLYHHLSQKQLKKIDSLNDFTHTGTRELTAEDYAYQIKRLAAPWVNSPIYGIMKDYVVGLEQLHEELRMLPSATDLRSYPMEGVKVIDAYTLQIKIKGYYPQFNYWLVMPFFAPMPWEAEAFYQQAGLKNKQIGLDWNPIGTGAYMLIKNNPNLEMILQKNPNYHPDYFPEVDANAYPQLAHYSQKRLPFIDTYVFSLEKEAVPRWHKFLQGYYDQSSVSSEQYWQSISYDLQGKPQINPALAAQGIKLNSLIQPAIYYLGFNMLDPVVGGYTNQARNLRKAISTGIDFSEYNLLFLNGQGIRSNNPIPPGILGHTDNPPTSAPFRLEEAKSLLQAAGYPQGIDPKTGRPLVLRLNVVNNAGADQRAQLDWLRQQFARLGLELQVETTYYNRFQDKLRQGDIELFYLGWSADYPDPENFLFLFYGPNSKVKSNGENASNYSNPQFDSLYEALQNEINPIRKKELIKDMLAILQEDVPWAISFYQQTFQLSHQWVAFRQLQGILNNNLKYWAIDPRLRASQLRQWNTSHLGYLLWVCLGLMLIILPAIFLHFCKKKQRGARMKDD